MKSDLVLLLCLSFLLFSAAIFAQSVNHAVVSIETKQPGLAVIIDGKNAGFTPLQNLPLAPGKHEIAVRRAQPESWLDYDWVEICSLQAGDTLKLTPRFFMGYSLNSTPFGAEVYINGILQGTTPLVWRLPEGEIVDVEIRKTGFQAESLQIGKIDESVSAMRLYAVVLKPEKNVTMPREFEGSPQQADLSRQRHTLLSAAGVSLASGIAAILLKGKADYYYEQYLTASLPSKRDISYKYAQMYDLYSNMATVVFEVSFAVSFYFFLKSVSK
jgi:hypothetical protein